MKKVFKILVLGLFIALGSCSEDVISKEEIAKSETKKMQSKMTQQEVLIYHNSPHERGYAGPGVYTPGVAGFKDCNKPNGLCEYLQSFGGGQDPIWTAKYIGNEKIRIENVVEIIVDEILIGAVGNNNFTWYSAPGMPGTEIDIELITAGPGTDATIEYLTNFIKNHYNIPRFVPFHDSINNQFVTIMGLPEGSQIYTVPGEYKIVKDSEHPNGYFDMDVFVQHTGEAAPPAVPTTEANCIPVWYNNQWTTFCN